MKKSQVLKKLAQRGYRVSESDLRRCIDAGWCPNEYRGEYPDDTVEELVASFELECLLDKFRPQKNFKKKKGNDLKVGGSVQI